MALRRAGRSPRFLDFAVAGGVLFQLAGVYFAPRRALLGTEAIGLADLGWTVLAATVPGLVVLLVRVIGGLARPGR